MHGVVVGEPSGRVIQHADRIRCAMDRDVVALEGLYEGFGHPVTLRLAIGCAAGSQADVFGKVDGVPSNVA